MTPARCSASRLGWVALMGAMVCHLFSLTLIGFNLGLVGVLLLSFIIAVALIRLEPVLYRWVTAPEREEDPLT